MNHRLGGTVKNQNMDNGDNLQEALETLMVYFPYNATLGCLVILLNSLILYFYHKQYRKFVPCMYLLIALFDCLMIVFMTISYCLIFKLKGKSSHYILKHKWVVIGFEMGEKWSLRMSIFINTLLSVARTLKTVRPFSEIKMKKALLSVILYGSYWSILISLDVFSLTANLSHINENYLSDERRFKRVIVEDRVGSETVHLIISDPPDFLKFFITFSIPYVLPVLVCLVSATVMIVHLRKEPPSRQSASTQRHVSVTVLLITVSFVLCLCVPALYDLALEIGDEIHGKNVDIPVHIRNNEHVLDSTPPLVNALLSPTIMIWRSAELRKRVGSIFRKFRRSRETENLEMQQF